MNELNNLLHYLEQIPTGAISNVGPIEDLLVDAWDELNVSGGGGMRDYKLRGRTKKMEWKSPVLTFEMVRHGGIGRGSKRAEIQSWTINIAAGTASVVISGFRQLYPMDAAWKAEPVARELARSIIAQQKSDTRLIWNQNGHVHPAIGKILPGSNRQTKAGRSRRFWKALISELLPHGWQKVGKHFEKSK